MTWYTAVLVVRSRVGDGWNDDQLVDHQVRLVSATNPSEAYEAAVAIGEEERVSYLNGDGEVVTWEFLGLSHLAELLDASPSHGVEVFSWRSRDNAEDLVVPREELEVFRPRDSRTAREILEDRDKTD
jgi:hypothetical protein